MQDGWLIRKAKQRSIKLFITAAFKHINNLLEKNTVTSSLHIVDSSSHYMGPCHHDQIWHQYEEVSRMLH